MDESSAASTDTDDLTHYLEPIKDCRYTILYNDPGTVMNTDKSILVNEVHNSADEGNTYHTSLNCNEEDMKEIQKFCITQCNGINGQGQFKMVIGTAWTLKNLHEIAKAYGQVIYIDVTESTNNKLRPLLTISTRIGMNNVVTNFGAVLPNNQRLVYKWITQNGIPDLLTRHFCNGVKVILTDGDCQEYEMIDICLITIFKNAKRVRCGWHIVDLGWKRHIDRNIYV
eukprot:15358040-Ditylum_brightwellii.AAC.2